MDRKASTATTNSLNFFSFHVIRAVGRGHDAAALERQGILYYDRKVNRLGLAAIMVSKRRTLQPQPPR
jgi:hypothetical protein